MVCHHCGVKGHGVNKCTKLTHAQNKHFWDERNNAWHEKDNTAPKEGNYHADVSKDAKTTEDDVARVKYEHYQRLMNAMEELDIGMVQVGHSDTGVVEDTKAGINVFSRGTYNPGKHVFWYKIT